MARTPLISVGPAFSPFAVSAEVSSTYETTAAPWLSVVTWRKSPRLRSPPVVQPMPLVQTIRPLLDAAE